MARFSLSLSLSLAFLLAAFAPLASAQKQTLGNVEIFFENSGNSPVTLNLYNDAGILIYTEVIDVDEEPSTSDWVSDVNNPGSCGILDPDQCYPLNTGELYVIEFVVQGISYPYTFKFNTNSIPISFYHPYLDVVGGGDEDLHFVNEVGFGIRANISLMDSLGWLDEIFTDSYWVMPYHVDYACDEFGATNSSCTSAAWDVFFTPQTYLDLPLGLGANAPTYRFTGDTDVVLPAQSSGAEIRWDLPDLVVEFEAGAGLVVEGDLSAEGVTFTDTGQGWDGIAVYQGGSLDLDGATVSEATVGVSVFSDDVTITDSDLIGNGIGLKSGYLDCQNPPCIGILDRGAFTLDGSQVANNTGRGLEVRNTDAVITDTEIADNGSFGLYLWNADVAEFRLNRVTGNGNDGIEILDNGDLQMTNDNFDAGLDCVTDNTDEELWVDLDGYLFVGNSTAGGDNAILDDDLTAATYLIYRETDLAPRPDLMPAQQTYWGTGGAPPAGAFNTGAHVDDGSPLATNPTGSSVCDGGTAQQRFAKEGAGATRDRAWLRTEIRRLRQALRQALLPGGEQGDARGVLRELYAMQRLDRADGLGEHAATMALLASVRGLLGGEGTPPALRGTAETALVAEVADVLRHGAYAEAENLLAAHAEAVTGETARRSVALHAAMADEAAGRFEAALAKLEGVRAELAAEGADEKVAALAPVAEALAVQAGVEPPSGAHGGYGANASSNAASRGEASGSVADAFVLSAVYPNPVADLAVLMLKLGATADATVAVYDVLGRRVATLAEGRVEAGTHQLTLDASALPAGVYVVRATSGERVVTQRITVIR